MKYHLVADTEGAFGQIVDGVEAALSRGADGAATYTDAFAAATQGMGAFTDSLNSEYDARYKVISAMEDGAEKERQLGELRTWYDTQAQAATEQYYNTLLQTAEQTGVFAEGGQFAETAAQLQNINTLMHAAAGKDGMSSEMTALREALAGLDETSIVELESAIAAMETAAADAGQSVPEEVLAAKTALEEVKAAATDTSNVFSEDVATSIDTMFSGLGDETHEVFASLNCDNLSTAYDAWVQGEHQSIIPTLDTESLTEIELTGNITNVLAKEGATFEVDTSGNITEVKWPEGTTFETDVKGNITEATTPEGTVYTVDAEGHITSVSKPDGVTYSVDTQGNVTGITTPDGTAFTVDAEGNVTSITTGGDNPFTVDCTGNIKDVTWPEGTTYETDVNGNVTGITTPDGASYSVDAAGNITSVTAQSGVTYSVDGSGKITAVALDPSVTLPTVDLQATATVSQVNFDEGQFTNSGRPDLGFEAGANKTNNNFLGWQDWSASGTVEQLHTFAQAVRDLEAAKAEVTAMEDAGIPDVTAYDAATQKVNALGDSVTYLGQSLGTEMSYEGGLGFQAMAQYVANGMQLIGSTSSPGSCLPLPKTVEILPIVLYGFSSLPQKRSHFRHQVFFEIIDHRFPEFELCHCVRCGRLVSGIIRAVLQLALVGQFPVMEMQSLILHIIEAQEPFLRECPDRLVNRRVPHLVDDHGNILSHKPLLILLDLVHDLPEQRREFCVISSEFIDGFPERLYLLPELFLIDLILRRVQ